MSFQIATFKPEEIKGVDITDPVAVTRLDVVYWPESPGQCIPYADGIEDEFKAPGIRAATRLDIFTPSPGQIYRFRRDKVMECQLAEDRHRLKFYMSDDIHEMEVQMIVSADGNKVEDIGSRCMRAPYTGICCRPYQQVSLMEGAALDSEFRQKVVEAVGGERGCVHLVDFITDMIRYRKKVCLEAGLEV